MRRYPLILIPLMFTLLGCSNDPKEVHFELNNEDEVNIHTDLQQQFLDDNNYNTNLIQYGSGDQDLEKPLPVKLSFKVTSAKKYVVEISENENMSNPITYQIKKKSLDVYNLKTGTTYYWRVNATYPSNTFTSDIASFTVKSGLRNILVDGLENIRDIGGYALENGKTVKQGLVYRCAKLNESSVATPKITITKKGINTLVNDLGIKTDIDLRKTELDEEGNDEIGGIKSSPLGDTVKYENCPMYYEGSTVLSHTNSAKNESNRQNIAKMFNLLGDRNNYPLIFHCTQGKDRTGAMAFLLETLLGVQDDDIYHDYLFTNLSKIGGGYCQVKAIESGYYFVLRKYNGETYQERAINYLLDIGVTQQTINNILDILIS
ncbi:MAG: tyrosine-protein phosphatase [Bacilli bacterium]|nr:tyrosine-protein phosphatase [Bacilli bacterium]